MPLNMTTLVVTIPAHNERSTIAAVIEEIPRDVPGIDNIQVLVFDDGSTDGTREIAQAAGADVVLSHKRRQGLATTFRECLEYALALGADIIVNTDGDNHYDQSRIPELVRPVVSGEADIVIGSRDLRATSMDAMRKWGNRTANAVLSFLYDLPPGTDVSSGFRAYSREAALRLTITSTYTYTHETLIDARDHGLVVVSIPFAARLVARPSRLMSSILSHLVRAGSVAFVSFAIHRLFHILTLVSALFMLAGIGAYIRFLYFEFTSDGGGHIQSLVAGSLLIVLGIQLLMGSLFAAALGKNRRLLEELIYRQRRASYQSKQTDAGKSDPNEAFEDQALPGSLWRRSTDVRPQ